MPCTLILCLVSFYLVEVVFGSSPGVYNPELGYDVTCEEMIRITNKQFFLQLLPIVLCGAGFMFLLAHIF